MLYLNLTHILSTTLTYLVLYWTYNFISLISCIYFRLFLALSCNFHFVLTDLKIKKEFFIYTFCLAYYPLCNHFFRELYKNNIQGPIPNELGNLKSLISLDLYSNNISGTIPPSLGKLKSLVFLWVRLQILVLAIWIFYSTLNVFSIAKIHSFQLVHQHVYNLHFADPRLIGWEWDEDDDGELNPLFQKLVTWAHPNMVGDQGHPRKN